MSIFRPAVRVTSPDRREWEIYAYKIKVREVADLATQDRSARGILWILTLIPRLLDTLYRVALAAVRSVGSDEWTIDAVTYMPRETVYAWKTTSEHKGQVLAQVQGHLQRGDIPVHLRNALYLGERRLRY